MIKPEQIHDLGQIVGKNNLLVSREELLSYSYDASALWTHMPDVVVLPDNAKQVAGVLKFADANRIPITPRGGGTNRSGGSIPIQGGIVLGTTRMNCILEINKTNLNATVEPGVILEDFNVALAKEGLFFPPDPQSYLGCTMGGVVAENAGGPSCLKYGVTKQYVLGLEVVLADGRIMKLGGLTPKNRTGYELAMLFIGSEGTLGMITKICFRLLPAPKATKSILVAFNDVAITTETISDIISCGILPCRIEFCSGPRWHIFFSSKQDLETGTVLLIQVDGLPETVEIEAQQILDICRKNRAVETILAKDTEHEESFWEMRRGSFAAAASRAPTVLTEDVCVPRDRLTEFVNRVKQISEEYNISINLGGHAGDGNFHPGVATDKNNEEHFKHAWKCVDDIVDAALSLGGVISGEHGIGLEKRKFLMKAMDPVALEIMKKVKDVLDPNHILNPGKIWQEPTDG
ncbi:FAD-binding oxidoreductase [Chloroflexota bacterium]